MLSVIDLLTTDWDYDATFHEGVKELTNAWFQIFTGMCLVAAICASFWFGRLAGLHHTKSMFDLCTEMRTEKQVFSYEVTYMSVWESVSVYILIICCLTICLVYIN